MNSGQQQGKLILNCIAFFPDSTTLYGIPNASSSSEPYNEYTILVTSDPSSNPSRASDIQWIIVSMVKILKRTLRNLTAGTVTCAVSEAG
ncbi:hypothetical protein BGZ47_005453 [Haplosporangium gracile]|nr:hypothetical protein BGZ47_005453 [Haplosporangium gracile]